TASWALCSCSSVMPHFWVQYVTSCFWLIATRLASAAWSFLCSAMTVPTSCDGPGHGARGALGVLAPACEAVAWTGGQSGGGRGDCCALDDRQRRSAYLAISTSLALITTVTASPVFNFSRSAEDLVIEETRVFPPPMSTVTSAVSPWLSTDFTLPWIWFRALSSIVHLPG